jgi:hypothetical protein
MSQRISWWKTLDDDGNVSADKIKWDAKAIMMEMMAMGW